MVCTVSAHLIPACVYSANRCRWWKCIGAITDGEGGVLVAADGGAEHPLEHVGYESRRSFANVGEVIFLGLVVRFVSAG
jgi:hypothetical protein